MSAGSVDVGDVSLNSQAESGGALHTGSNVFTFAPPEDKTELYVLGGIALVVAFLFFKKKGR